jgi:malonyl-CoA O-methyltransferase
MSHRMLERARRRVRAEHVRFVEHDIRRPWPLPRASADLVIANLVLEHVETLDPVFAEAHRVLRARGLLFLCELHPFRQLQGVQARFASAETGELVRVPAWLHDVSQYVTAALAAGFTLQHLGEWRDTPDAPRTAPPRLLSLLLARDDAR